MNVGKELKALKLIRKARYVSFFTIGLMITLSMIHPIVLGQKQSAKFVVDMEWQDSFIEDNDERLNHLDASRSNTGMEGWSDDFISIGAEVPEGVYYGSMLHEYMTDSLIDHNFVDSFQEKTSLNHVWFQNEFIFGRNMIMSGASEFWIKLPITANSVRSYFDEADTFDEDCTGAGADTAYGGIFAWAQAPHLWCDILHEGEPELLDLLELGGYIPTMHLMMWEKGNKEDTFFHRPIIVDNRLDETTTAINGLAIINNRIYVRARYTIFPDTIYVFKLIFPPAAGRVNILLTDEITTLNSRNNEIHFSEYVIGRDPPQNWPADRDVTNAGTEVDYYDNFIMNNYGFSQITEDIPIPDELQPVWNFMFTQGMDEGMFGVKQRFFPGDTLILSPYIDLTESYLDGNAEGTHTKRLNLFIPWVNHDNKEFRVDLRVGYSTHNPKSPLQLPMFYDDVNGATPIYNMETPYFDTREDHDLDGVVEGDENDLDRLNQHFTSWNLIEGTDISDSDKTHYSVYRGSTSGITTTKITQIQFAVGKEAVAYYHGYTQLGTYIKGVDSTDLVRTALDIKRGIIKETTPKYTSDEDSWKMGIQEERPATEADYNYRDATYQVSPKTMDGMIRDSTKVAHFTIHYRTSDGEEYQVNQGDSLEFDDDTSDFVGYGKGVLVESEQLTGSANTYTFEFNDEKAEDIVEVWVSNVKGPIAYRVSKFKNDQHHPEDSDGILVKDFLLYTIPIRLNPKPDIVEPVEWYSIGWPMSPEELSGQMLVYIIFREEIELTLLAHTRSTDRPYWPRGYQNVAQPMSEDGQYLTVWPAILIGIPVTTMGAPVNYYHQTYMMPNDYNMGGYYGVIARNMEPTTTIVDRLFALGNYEPLGYEIHAVLEPFDADSTWDMSYQGNSTHRPYRRYAGFQTIAFTGLYTADVYIPADNEIVEVVILDGKNNNGGGWGSKEDLLAGIAGAIRELIGGIGAIPGFIQTGIEWVANIVLEIIPGLIMEGLNWIWRQISGFFGEFFTVLTDIIGAISQIVTLGMILLILGAFAYILMLVNRFMEALRTLAGKVTYIPDKAEARR